MKIILANKFYYRRGGDCICTMNLQRLLEQHGHEVAIFSMQYPQNEDSRWKSYWPSEMIGKKVLTRPFGSPEVKRCFTRLLDDFKPDVVHLNNIHTQLSPVIAELAHERGIGVVWTLHDTKPVCPCYTCTRAGMWCEDCVSKPLSVVRHRCIHGSLPGSVIGYLEKKKWSASRLSRSVDLFMPPSRFLADTLINGGFDSDKIKVMCNFIDLAKCKGPEVAKGDHYIYVGRVEAIKGLRTLCRAARSLDHRLIVVGNGDLLPELQREYADSEHIEFMGQMSWEEFKPLLQSARFMVIPSEWSENNPLTVIESQSVGTPVLGARIGGIPELIEEGVSGMTFNSGDVRDLRLKIKMMYDHSFDYRGIARAATDRYSDEAYYNRLMDIYRSISKG